MRILYGYTFAALLAGFVLSPAALAQSHELSVLAGAANPAASIGAGTIVSGSSGASASVLVGYAQRVAETRSGNLYVELPAARVFKASVGVRSDRLDVSQSQFFFTPGLRYVFAPAARVSPYVAGGFGFGWFDSVQISFGGPLSAGAMEGFKPAAGFGGGAAIRITRFLAFRAELRDFVNCAGNVSSRNHLVYAGGFGFRF